MAENNITQGVEELGVRIGIIAKPKSEWQQLSNFIPKFEEKIYITDLFEQEENQMGYIIGDGETPLSSFLEDNENNKKYHHHLIEDRLAILESDPYELIQAGGAETLGGNSQ